MQRKFPELRGQSYTSVPRGRVVMNMKTQRMEVWGAPAVLNNSAVRNRITSLYALKPATDWVTNDVDINSHYTGAHGPNPKEEEKQLMLFAAGSE
jgi:hypothetical protein